MKQSKVLSVLVAATVLFGFAGSVFAAPFDLELTHRDSTDSSDVVSYLTPPTYGDGVDAIPYFQGRDDNSGVFLYFTVGSGVSDAGGILSVTDNTIETPEGHLTDTLNGKVSTSTFNGLSSTVSSLSSTVSGLSSTVAGLGSGSGLTLASVMSFMSNQATTSQLIATSSFNGFMSGAMVTKLAAVSTSTRLMATSTRSIVTGTGATGFQVSSTRDAEVRYSTTIVTTSNLTGSQNGTIVLEIAPTNSATSTDWTEIGRCTNGTSYTLAVAIQGVGTQACQITGYAPAGYWEKLRSINNSGTPTFSFNSGQEVLQ